MPSRGRSAAIVPYVQAACLDGIAVLAAAAQLHGSERWLLVAAGGAGYAGAWLRRWYPRRAGRLALLQCAVLAAAGYLSARFGVHTPVVTLLACAMVVWLVSSLLVAACAMGAAHVVWLSGCIAAAWWVPHRAGIRPEAAVWLLSGPILLAAGVGKWRRTLVAAGVMGDGVLMLGWALLSHLPRLAPGVLTVPHLAALPGEVLALGSVVGRMPLRLLRLARGALVAAMAPLAAWWFARRTRLPLAGALALLLLSAVVLRTGTGLSANNRRAIGALMAQASPPRATLALPSVGSLIAGWRARLRRAHSASPAAGPPILVSEPIRHAASAAHGLGGLEDGAATGTPTGGDTAAHAAVPPTPANTNAASMGGAGVGAMAGAITIAPSGPWEVAAPVGTLVADHSLAAVPYLRQQAYELYSGSGWQPAPAGQPPGAGYQGPGTTDAARIVMFQAQSWVALPWASESVDSAGVRLAAEGDRQWAASPDLPANHPYLATFLVPDYALLSTELSGVAADPSPSPAYLQLPAELPARVRTLAARIVRGQRTPWDRAVTLATFLRDTYPYDLRVSPPPAGRDWVDYFLFSAREGYCTYFSTAMTVMARTLGIPAREVSGYADLTRTGADTYTLWGPLHAWTELYFPRVGWVPFDATSGSVGDPKDLRGAPVGALVGGGLGTSASGAQADRGAFSAARAEAQWRKDVGVLAGARAPATSSAPGGRPTGRHHAAAHVSGAGAHHTTPAPTPLRTPRPVRRDGFGRGARGVGALLASLTAVGALAWVLGSILRRAKWLRHLLSWGDRRVRAWALPAGRRGDAAAAPAHRVLSAYRRLERRLANEGRRRQGHVTPQAFLAELGAAAEAGELARLFYSARYSAAPMSDDDARAAESAAGELVRTVLSRRRGGMPRA